MPLIFSGITMNVVLVDYRGFGKSTGKRSEKDMLNDMQFVYNTLIETYHENHLIVYGRSLGSGFAAHLASENKPRYLITGCTLFQFYKSGGKVPALFADETGTSFSYAYRSMAAQSKLPHLHSSRNKRPF
jgi:pimeloyl-ACP methyl ester carboxylesterase